MRSMVISTQAVMHAVLATIGLPSIHQHLRISVLVVQPTKDVGFATTARSDWLPVSW